MNLYTLTTTLQVYSYRPSLKCFINRYPHIRIMTDAADSGNTAHRLSSAKCKRDVTLAVSQLRELTRCTDATHTVQESLAHYRCSE